MDDLTKTKLQCFTKESKYLKSTYVDEAEFNETSKSLIKDGSIFTVFFKLHIKFYRVICINANLLTGLNDLNAHEGQWR